MIRPPLYSTPFGTNTTNRITSPIDLVPIRTEIPDPTTLIQLTDLPTRPAETSTRPTDSLKQKVKSHVPADLDSDPSLSDS